MNVFEVLLGLNYDQLKGEFLACGFTSISGAD